MASVGPRDQTECTVKQRRMKIARRPWLDRYQPMSNEHVWPAANRSDLHTGDDQESGRHRAAAAAAGGSQSIPPANWALKWRQLIKHTSTT